MTPQILSRFWFVVLVIVSTTLLHFFSVEMESPKRDEARYVDYALNLSKHGVFGLSCGDLEQSARPSQANTPLYPFLLSGVARIDTSLQSQFSCALATQGVRADCVIGTGLQPSAVAPRGPGCEAENYQSILFIQHILLAISLLLVFGIAKKIFVWVPLQWLTLAAAFLSGVLTQYVDRFLTENLLIVLFLVLQYCLIHYWQRRNDGSVFFVTISMVLLALTRPEYLYLAFAWVLVLILVAAVCQELRYVRHTALALLIIVLGLSPWVGRNVSQFDSFSVSAGKYGEIILSYRTAYNEMDLRHWLGSFIYFLPDFGDSLAKRALPQSWYWRELDERAGSYQDIANQKVEAMVQSQTSLKTMIVDDVLSQPIKHALVTVPLAWRGAFIAKYFGLIGLFAYLFLQYRELKAGRYELAVISLPVWFIVFFHAAVSINIPRYNLPLVSLYALGWASMFNRAYLSMKTRLVAA